MEGILQQEEMKCPRGAGISPPQTRGASPQQPASPVGQRNFSPQPRPPSLPPDPPSDDPPHLPDLSLYAEQSGCPATPPSALGNLLDTVAAGCKKLTRQTWSDTEKKAVLDLLAFHNGMKRQTLDFLQSRYGNAFKTVSLHTLKRWQNAQQRALDAGTPGTLNRKRGKKVCTAFEDEVYHKIVLDSSSNNDTDAGNVRIYATIIQTAELLRESEKWKDDDKVQKLKFSHKWCHSLLRRHNEQVGKVEISFAVKYTHQANYFEP